MAARAGVVMNSHGRSSGPSITPGDGGNWIRVLHSDGTMAIYAHLQTGSLTVAPGQRVRRGQQVGRSGNTGYSTGPHLHFAVQRNAGLHLESIPVKLNGPQGLLQPLGNSSPRP